MRTLEPGMFVSGQITAADVAALAAAGVRLIVNNRPDGEEPGQPTAAEIAAAAEAADIAYRHIPVAGLDAAQIPQMAGALAGAGGDTLAFCRSGTRSTYLWALARATQGADRDMLIGKAAEAGYDLTPIARFL